MNFTLSLGTGELVRVTDRYTEVRETIESLESMLKGASYRVHAREIASSTACTCKFCKGGKS